MTCARLRDGTARCWGDPFAGALGGGGPTEATPEPMGPVGMPIPVAVLNVAGAVEIAAGSTHACVRLASGTVKCWGENEHGQLGDGSTTDRSTPVDVAGLLP